LAIGQHWIDTLNKIEYISFGTSSISDWVADSGGQWQVLGNSGTDPSNNFLGTIDNQGLSFRTNNSQRIRVDENGRVLIGNQVTPSGFFHIKQHANYDGTGHIIETATIQLNDTNYNNLYSIAIPDFSVVMMEFRAVAIEAGNVERASFVRTGTWFRQGANAQKQGLIQSDYTNKSDNSFDVKFTETSDTIFFDVKNANANDTRWEVTIKMDIILNDA
jgi:hypothetical protein